MTITIVKAKRDARWLIKKLGERLKVINDWFSKEGSNIPWLNLLK
jgi:hypothetical protein